MEDKRKEAELSESEVPQVAPQSPAGAPDVYERILQLKGKVRFGCTLAELKDDRETLTHCTHPREMTENVSDDLKDYQLATEILDRVRKGKEKIYSSAQMRADLGLDPTQS